MKNKDDNPMMHMPGALLWIFCCPLALIICAHYDFKKSEAKRKAKLHKRAVENWDRWWG
ncbi:MAG: hypothetical protein K6D98_00285 [Clostridiales bacterium]|nr:hypothetical protein [Clostridiales bacterium]